MDQPTPTVSQADVERVAKREFPADMLPEIMETLEMYIAPEPYRVQLAVMKLANGKFGELKRYVRIANEDWRDVLGLAEYPLATQNLLRWDELTRKELQKIIDADWLQYSDWLHK